MTRNEFNLLYAVKKHGIRSHRKLKEFANVSTGFISQTLRRFTENGWIDQEGITEKGLTALKPYKVDNAVIMAAGMSTRFVPLSLEKPKGLLVVKNEVLIERQIRQLKEAGIHDIVIVLGYKKESFFYLESKFEGLRFVINPEYNTKNNSHTIYLAGDYIGNTYICSSDNYFEDNPFDEYVYQSYYAAQHVTEKTSEWYMFPDAKGNIAKVEIGGFEGDIMLGHVYWNREFSKAMLKIINEAHETGSYDNALWERVLIENLKILPPMEIKVYPSGSIFEFDSLDELRTFDSTYVDHTQSRIMNNITKVLNCNESDILNFKIIKNGLTNTSFVFEVNGTKYVYRHPGDVKDTVINRKHEKAALELAKSIGADPTFIYMDENEGFKISYYVENIRTPRYDSHEDSSRILTVLKKLHENKLNADWSFLPWEEASKIENILRNEKNGISDQEIDQLRDTVGKCYEKCRNDGVEKCFCHCDTYAQNWMMTDDGKTILIDWEYAGNADPGNDVGCYVMDAGWDLPEAERFIKRYLGDKYDDTLRFHYLAYVAIVSYYWYVWALYRESCGTVMGESLYNWRVMAKKYGKYCIEHFNP